VLFDKYAPVNFDTFVANLKKNGWIYFISKFDYRPDTLIEF
jgi:hypothetical protein